MQRISFLGMKLNLVEQTACLTEERTLSVLNCLNSFKGRKAVPLKKFQRLLGHMEAASYETALALAPWLSPEVGSLGGVGCQLGCQLQWHINCLELLVMRLALNTSKGA